MLKAGTARADLLLITLTLAALTAICHPPAPALAALTAASLTALVLVTLRQRRRP